MWRVKSLSWTQSADVYVREPIMDPLLDDCVRAPIMDPLLDDCVRAPIIQTGAGKAGTSSAESRKKRTNDVCACVRV